MTIVNAATINITNETYQSDENIVNIDLNYCPFSGNDMSYAFSYCPNLTTITNINNKVTNMSYAFSYCENLIDAPIIGNKVTNMDSAFYNCYNLVNITTISNNVTDMSYAFFYCNNLVNVPDLSNCSNLTIMSGTFGNCTNLVNAPVLPNSVINMYETFSDTNIVDAPEIPDSVTDMGRAFANCYRLQNVNKISNSVTNMYETFYFCYNLVNVPEIPNSVVDMMYAFSGCNNLVNIPNMSNATNLINMDSTFWNCANLVNAPVIPNSVTDMSYTFEECQNLVNVPNLSNCNNLTDMDGTFWNCTNLVNAPVIPNSVTNMSYTFDYCVNLTGDIIIYSENVNEVNNCFNNTSLTKNVYIPFIYQNGVNTATYNSFTYYYGNSENGVVLKDIVSIFNLDDWYYSTYENGIRRLTSYIGENIDVIVPPYKTILNKSSNSGQSVSSSVFLEKAQFINSVDLSNVSYINNDMMYAFAYCNNLTTVTNINNNVTNMHHAFANCKSLVNVPVIPNSVISLWSTFDNCASLVNAPKIPESVTNMRWTFGCCNNLTGDIIIYSENIGNAYYCFYETSLQKNVYIPFTYENGVNTRTYNTFYQYYGSGENGVILYDIKYWLIEDWDYITLNNRTRILYNYTGVNTNISVPSIKTLLNNYNSTDISNVPLYNNPIITNVDMNNVAFIDNDMSYAFYNCTNLTTVTNINENITNMRATFSDCYNLTGDIIIRSENIINVYDCFSNTSIDKNVYIPFTYDNGVYTTTYNSFLTAGYSDSSRVSGVLLMDLNDIIQLFDYSFVYDIKDNSVLLTKYINNAQTVIVP